jgi:hypothetical protein
MATSQSDNLQKPAELPSSTGSRLKRIAVWGSVASVVVAHLVLIPMKWRGLLPDKSWPEVILGPVLLATLVPLAVCTEGKKTLLWFSILILLAMAMTLLARVPSGCN